MNNKIIKSSIILLFGGIITKFLGMIIKIIMTRIVGIKGISLYMMILPTFSLFMSIGQIGLPISLSRMVALNNKNNFDLYLSIIPVVLIFNLVLMFFLILFSQFISSFLLHNINLRYGIIAISLVLPFTSISSICRSYFIGKENMFPSVFSNICENVIRILFIVFILPKLLFLDVKFLLFFIVISNVISELCSTIILLLFIPHSKKQHCFKFNFGYIKEALSLSIYVVLSDIIGNISYFLEPIILTNVFLFLGYSINYINSNYGIITGYIIPLLLIPSFFTNAISQAILPSISTDYDKKNYSSIKNKIKIITCFLFLFGIFVSLIYFLFGDKILILLYGTSAGFNYLKFLAPFFTIYYIHVPYHIFLQAMGKMKEEVTLSIVSAVVRSISLIIFSFFRIGMYSFILSLIFNMFVTTYLLYRKIIYYLK